MEILFITPNPLGDTVLTMGVLHHLLEQYPEGRLTVACGPLFVSLFEAIPQTTRIVVLKKTSLLKHLRQFLGEFLWQKWDIVFDLRHAVASHLLFTKKYYTLKRNAGLHRVEENALCLKLNYTPLPHIWLTEDVKRKAEEQIPNGNFVLAISPVASWNKKSWPAENFIELLKRLGAGDGIFNNARIAVFGTSAEREQAEVILESIAASKRIDMMGRGNILEVAACLNRCKFFIGNDSGLMHLAAALDIPTLGLFGPSRPERYAPWGKHTAYVQTELSYEQLVREQQNKANLMESLTVDKVEEAVHKLYKQAR